MDFRHTEPAFDLVSIGNFWDNIKFQASFAAIGTGVFWKYVIMFLLINSLESLLTVKAIDGLDYQFFFGADKNNFSLEELKEKTGDAVDFLSAPTTRG